MKFRSTLPRNVHCARFASLVRLLVLVLFLLIFLPFSNAQLSVGAPEVLSETRIDRTVFEYVMRAKITNTGPAAAAISAQVTSSSPATVIVENTLTFGNVGPATNADSIDTFTIAHDRTVPFDPAVLHWTIKQPFIVSSFTPQSGGSDVGVTVRPQVFFSKPVDPATLNTTNFYASFAGQKLPATILLANDGTFAWLFFTNPMPGASQVQVTVDGATIHLSGGADLLDAASTGTPGSKLTYNFSTVSVAPLANTTVWGRIVDPGPDLLPYTADDSQPGPDGVPMTEDDIHLLPIVGVKVFLIGLENKAVFTDAAGRFQIDGVPSGNVKVVIDGRTATTPPAGYYFPEMVMDAEMQPGLNNFVMQGMESMYLPRIANSILQNVSAGQTTMVMLKPEAALDLPPAQQPYLTVEVQPGSLVNNGQHVAAGQVGISVVPPELVRDMLPSGLLQHTFDITVQAPGITNFSTPAGMTFPNVFNAAPGTRLNFLSFDHTTGRLVIEGTCTVSADGLSVTTDPGTGITHPGWHGLAPPGSPPQPPFSCNLEFCIENPPPRPRRGNKGKFRTLGPQTTVPAVRGSSVQEPDYRFCFVPAPTSAAPAGCTRITPDDSYSAERGYGWDTSNATLDAAPDFGVFVLDLPDGLYGISVTLGDANAGHDNIEIYVQSTFANNVTTLPGQFVTNLYVFSVVGGKLHMSFGGLRGNSEKAAIARMEIQRIEDYLPAASIEIPNLEGRLFYYAYTNLENGLVLRGSATSLEEIPEKVFFPPNTRFLQLIFDPATLTVSSSAFTTRASGVAVMLPDVILYPPYDKDYHEFVLLDPFEPPFGGDSDGDGLSDDIEFILGSDPYRSSSCGDGMTDLAKVQQGLGFGSCGLLANGIVASLPLNGVTKEIAIVGSTTNSREQTVYVATGSGGLSIVNASQFQKPVLLSRLALPGDATDVSVDSNLQIAVLAADAGGLHFVNVADPLNPALLRTISAPVNQVEVVDGIAYAAVGSQLYSYDLLTGERLHVLVPGSSNITTLAREGSFLYSLDSSRVLRAIDISGPSMVARGSLTLPAGNGKLFVGGGIAYVGGGAGISGGFVTANVSNPNSLVLLSGVDANNVAGRRVVANGSGLAVAVGSLQGLGNFLDVLNVSDPTNTGAFITRFNLPAAPESVAIGAGIAFVADGTAGLQVVNYRAFDNQGVPPSVTINTAGLDVDSNTPGIQVVEGSLLPIKTQISDDVQVRSVELLVNGQVVRNDVSFPFELTAAMPTLASGATSVTVQVRATDTGGNVGISPLVTLVLVIDTTAPTIISISPVNNSARGTAFRTVAIQFSEPVDTTTATAANFQLIGPGGTVSPQTIQFRNNGTAVQLTYPTLAVGDYQIVLVSSAIKDRAGNALGATNATSNFTIKQATASWANAAGGFWDVASNWDGGQVPGPTDDVFISIPENTTVTFRSGNVVIRSLVFDSPFVLSGGTLNVATTVEVKDLFTISGGTLVGATLFQAGGVSLTASGGTLDGVTLATNLTVPSGVTVIVKNGLTLSNNARVTLAPNGTNSTGLSFGSGTQSLGGTGEIFFGGTGNGNFLYAQGNNTQAGAAALTIGAGITVHGSQGGTVGSIYSFDSIINQGMISADTAGKTITLNDVTNQGTVQAINGANLAITDMPDVKGISVSGGGTLTLNGTWANSGNLTATGSTLTLNGTWNNTGTIAAINSTVNVGGTFTLANLGTFNRTGGTVNVTGTLNNTGGTLTLNAVTGSWQLGGGTIKGGTITASDGASLTLVSFGTLDGVTLATNLTVPSGVTVIVKNGLTLSNNARVTLAPNGTNSTGLSFGSGTQSLGGTGEIFFGGTGNGNFLYAQGNNTQAGAAALTIGAGITVHGSQGGTVGSIYSFDSIINQGMISADTAGKTITLNDVTNQGTVQAINGANLAITDMPDVKGISVSGGGTLTLNGTWANSGNLTATGSTLTLNGTWNNTGTIAAINSTVNVGGTFTLANLGTFNRTGGTVNVTGTLNNTGGTLTLNAVTGSWQLGGGTIKGGTITASDGASLTLVSFGTLDGVTLATNLTVPSGVTVIVKNGLTLSNNARVTLAPNGTNSTGLSFGSGTQSLGGTGEIFFGGTGNGNFLYAQGNNTQAGAAALTIGAGITVHGSQGGTVGGVFSFDSIINQGTISADTAGKTITLSRVTNQGDVQAIGGGTLATSNAWTNSGLVRAGVGGTISMSGGFTNFAGGSVAIEIGGIAASQFGKINISGSAALAGTVNLSAVNGFDPGLGNTFNVMTYTSHTGQFDTVNGSIGNGKQFTVTYGPSSMTVNTVALSPVPTPVPGPPFTTSITKVDDSFHIEFQSVAGRSYRVEWCDDLKAGQWTPLTGEAITGTGAMIKVIDAELER